MLIMLIMIFGLLPETAKTSELLVQVQQEKTWRVSKLLWVLFFTATAVWSSELWTWTVGHDSSSQYTMMWLYYTPLYRELSLSDGEETAGLADPR